MSKHKPGEWWDKSWNVVSGCTPAGEGCKHCWARAMVRRFGHLHGGVVGKPSKPWGQVFCHPDRLDQPLRRKKPTTYAVSLLGDLFHDQVPDEFIRQVGEVMICVPRHQYVLLTKRWDRAVWILSPWWSNYRPSAPGPFTLMASVSTQAETDTACSALSRYPGRWGLHMEPLIEEVVVANPWGDYRTGRYDPLPSWVVVGGENGPGARRCDSDWIHDIADQCRIAGVPFWFKGWGAKSNPQPLAPLPREVPW